MRNSLSDFVKGAWPILEPATPLVWGPCLDAVCLHLEAVANGHIKKLIINIPPGHAKSTIASVMWPAWLWLKRPDLRILTCSYSLSLAGRDSQQSRYLINSEWYNRMFRPSWKMLEDQNKKLFYKNSQLGFRMALSVGSGTTGNRGNVLMIDDPHNVLDAVTSEYSRNEVKSWWDQAARSRVNDFKTSSYVIIGQRVHYDDLFGHLKNQGGFVELKLATEFDPDDVCETPIWRDWRTKPGELLFPERFDEEAIREVKSIGLDVYESQYQQNPTQKEGGFFKIPKAEIIDRIPHEDEIVTRVRAWDLARTHGGGDYTVGVKMSKTRNGKYIVEDVCRDRLGPAERNAMIEATCRNDQENTRIFIEQEPNSGKEVVATLVKMLEGLIVESDAVRGSKEVRADPFASQWNAGNVQVLKADWNTAYFNEFKQFPRGKHDDQVDASSLAFNRIANRNNSEIPWFTFRF